MFGPDDFAKIQEILGIVQALKPMAEPVLDTVFDLAKTVGEAYDRSGLQQLSTDLAQKKMEQLIAANFSREEAMLIILNSKSTSSQLSQFKLPSITLNKG